MLNSLVCGVALVFDLVYDILVFVMSHDGFIIMVHLINICCYCITYSSEYIYILVNLSLYK